MNKILSIAFFILVWFTCSGQTYNVFVLDSLGNNVGHITFKPDFQDGYVFYHLENLWKEPYQGCQFIAEDDFQNFINAYMDISKGKEFNLSCMSNSLEWNEKYTSLFFPTLIRRACLTCELPKELYDTGKTE